MKYFLMTIAYLSIFAGAGYLLIRFFSNISGVNLYNAITWGFKEKQFQFVIPMILFYIIAFVMLFSILTSVVDTTTAMATHKGGLLGYKDNDYQYRYFDPVSRDYTQITHYNPPPAAGKLNEAFEIVSFYKPPFSDNYKNVSDMSLVVSIIKIILFLIGIIPLCLVLYGLASEFGREASPAIILTRDMLQNNFHKISGLKLSTAVGAFVLIIAAITFVELNISGRIFNEHSRKLGAFSSEYQKTILRNVSPKSKLSGRVIRREGALIKKYTHSQKTKSNVLDRNPQYVKSRIYTVEFEGLANVPVYMTLQLTGDAKTNRDIKELDLLFDAKSSRPVENNNFQFIVNPDYSISAANSGSGK